MGDHDDCLAFVAQVVERLTNELVNKAEADLSARFDANQAAYATSRSMVIGFASGTGMYRSSPRGMASAAITRNHIECELKLVNW